MHATSLKGTILAIATATVLGISVDASAAEVPRNMMGNAPGLCQAVSPANDDKLRSYAIRLSNVSSSNVQISCALISNEASANGITWVYIYFKNGAAVSRTIECTLAAGSQFFGVTYITKSMTLTPGQYSSLSWDQYYDYNSLVKIAGLTCTLPPYTSAHEVGLSYSEYVGA
jgi:hypothetical protein